MDQELINKIQYGINECVTKADFNQWIMFHDNRHKEIQEQIDDFKNQIAELKIKKSK
jgi:hypothetical protein